MSLSDKSVITTTTEATTPPSSTGGGGSKKDLETENPILQLLYFRQ